FAYAACHDLQAPLRRTQGFCELLRRRYEGQLDENADSYLEAIGASVRHMQTLITDLLNFSRAGTKQLNLEMVSFQEVAQRAMDNLQAAIGEADGQVHVDPLPTLPADRTQMVQLLQNLIGNALTYHGSAPPLVHVSAEQGEKEVCFRVQDNGIGIAEEYVDEIFKIFKRLHSDSEYPGTGIGLATCQKIVQRHGGRIWVDSQPGKGSTFSFTLPLTPDMTGGDEG
ncbi:MAG: GHKL domain-containing protein, partial [Planctomycetales bacterium]|nr:GHKL domain-containing protein [Planctomycetales bacterium]